MPIRFRSRQQKCRIGSIEASRRICSAQTSDDIRAGARAIGDVDRVDAALVQRFRLLDSRLQVVAARRQQFDRRDPLTGGEPAPSRDFSASGAGSFGSTRAAVAAGVATFARTSGRTAVTTSRMCCGVVPQQPPTAEAPNATNRLAYSARYSGEQR